MYRKAVKHTKKLFSYKLVRYGVVGGLSTMMHIGIASLYIYKIKDSVLQSNIAGFLVAYVFSYIMQSIHVFGHAVSWQKAIRYFIVQFGSLLMSVMLSNLLIDYNSYVKTFFVIIFMPLITFVIHKVWTFGPSEK